MKIPSSKNEQSRQWPQFLAAFAATLAIFSTAFHTGWSRPSLPKLLSDEFPFDVSDEETSYMIIIGNVGNIYGGLLGAFVIDKIGRKKTILWISLPQMISFSLIALSYRLMELLYVARFIGGIGEGLTFTIIPMYIAEIAEPKIRGTLGTLTAVTCLTGFVYINTIGSLFTMQLTAETCLLFPIVFIVLFWWMPESPYFLLMKNREKEAEDALKFLRRKKNVSEELSVLAKDVKRQMSESGTFKEIFTIESNRKTFFVIVGTRMVQQFSGYAGFMLYIQLLLKEATNALEPYIGSTILLVVQLLMGILSTFFVDRWGRKPLLIFSTAGCCITLLLQALYFGLKEHTDVDVAMLDWFPLVMMVLYIILFSSGLGVVVNILNSEFFSASIKGKCVCLANIVFALSMLSVTKFYQTTADMYGLTVPYLSFGLFTLGGSVFLYFCLPETKGKSLEEIQQQLKGKRMKASLVL